MKLWLPDRTYFEPEALNYPLGKKIYEFCQDKSIEILQTTSHNQVRGIPGKDEKAKFANAKRTLVVGTKKNLKLDVCKPSAHYQFSLMTNCPGNCEYCYLFSTQGKRPYVRVYVNIEEIFDTIDKYIEKRLPKITLFEAASTGDPLAVEHITGALKKTIEYFGILKNGRLRLVTKFANIDPILEAKHNKNTKIRFSINSKFVIDNFEHNTDNLKERLIAAEKVSKAGYPLGFIIAPIIRHDNWKTEYKVLFERLHQHISFAKNDEITFELIQHRFTSAAKKVILERFPNTELEMAK